MQQLPMQDKRLTFRTAVSKMGQQPVCVPAGHHLREKKVIIII